MIIEKIYVRCAIDRDQENPREFVIGQVVEKDDFSEKASVVFHDPFKYQRYYEILPETVLQFPYASLHRCSIAIGASVEYLKQEHKVIDVKSSSEEPWRHYYVQSVDEKTILLVREDKLIAPFSSGHVEPDLQMEKYEIQNPSWYFSRYVVSRTMKVLENAIYGFKELAGCKIYLMPHQLNTIMRCLQETKLRFMLADEVGLGKTIEACALLKIYMSSVADSSILIVVPDTLKEQWRVELFSKFHIMSGINENNNLVELVSYSELTNTFNDEDYHFIIIDEAHRTLDESKVYHEIHKLSSRAERILLLTATPVQQQKKEYLKLLRLISPDRYDQESEEGFNELLNKQRVISKRAFSILKQLEDYIDEIQELGGVIDEETDLRKTVNGEVDELKELFDEIQAEFMGFQSVINNPILENLIRNISFSNKDFGLLKMQIAISYVCENYQIEKNIIRNRRRGLELAQRTLHTFSYEYSHSFNTYEANAYDALLNWIQQNEVNEKEFTSHFKPLLGAFFSSPKAFQAKYKSLRLGSSDELDHHVDEWIRNEKKLFTNIDSALDDPDSYGNRAFKILDYIDQEIIDKKVVVFTDFDETFTYYKDLFIRYFGEDKCCFFSNRESSDLVETEVLRFQNDPICTILLSDASGGEGRNFQIADYVIHVDLPWDANAIEQRIGRLDRIGRASDRDVISVVCYAENTIEEQLFRFWNEGLNIFQKSISGLEIMLKEVNTRIVDAIIGDLKFGLQKSIDGIIELSKEMEKIIIEDQYYDTAGYKYKPLYRELERMVRYYNQNENELFASTMMSWANMAGLHAQRGEDEGVIAFEESNFSINAAKNTLLIPPDFDEYMNAERYRYTKQIRERYKTQKKTQRQEKGRRIEGTFIRDISVKNEYIHFFAPGDKIYDAIVNNSIQSYRGQCTAMAVRTKLDWKGFVFTWSISPDMKYLHEKGLSINLLSPYRNFLAQDPISIFVPFTKYQSVDINAVKAEFERLIESGYQKVEIEHLGKRSNGDGFLGIYSKYHISNMDWFKFTHSDEQWKSEVRNAKKIAKNSAIRLIKDSSHISGAKGEIRKIIETQSELKKYYGDTHHSLNENSEEVGRTLLECLSKPVLTLDSLCYVWMVNS